MEILYTNHYILIEVIKLITYTFLFLFWILCAVKSNCTLLKDKKSSYYLIFIGTGVMLFSQFYRSWVSFYMSGGDFDVMYLPDMDVSEFTYKVACEYISSLLNAISLIIYCLGLFVIFRCKAFQGVR